MPARVKIVKISRASRNTFRKYTARGVKIMAPTSHGRSNPLHTSELSHGLNE